MLYFSKNPIDNNEIIMNNEIKKKYKIYLKDEQIFEICLKIFIKKVNDIGVDNIIFNELDLLKFNSLKNKYFKSIKKNNIISNYIKDYFFKDNINHIKLISKEYSYNK